MTDRWERPVADSAPAHRRDAVVVDVPLTGDDAPGATDDGPDAAPPNWRRLIGVAMIVGVVAGVAVAVVRIATDGGETGSPGDEAGAMVTTPPTLRPLETLPRPGDDAGSHAPSVEPVNAPTPPAPVTVPVYPPADDAVLSEIVQFDVVAALARNDDDVARRSVTHVELGYGGYVLDVTIERDPANDRYRLVLESRDGVEELIVDIGTGQTYIETDADDPVTIRTSELIGPDTAVNDSFDRLLQGPFRTDTYDPVATRGRGLVTIDGIGDAREYLTFVDGDLVPEWQIHAFAPANEFRVTDRPEALKYTVYVDEADRIVQVDGVAMLGIVPQLVQHRITVPDDPIVIELPDWASAPDSSEPAE